MNIDSGCVTAQFSATDTNNVVNESTIPATVSIRAVPGQPVVLVINVRDLIKYVYIHVVSIRPRVC